MRYSVADAKFTMIVSCQSWEHMLAGMSNIVQIANVCETPEAFWDYMMQAEKVQPPEGVSFEIFRND